MKVTRISVRDFAQRCGVLEEEARSLVSDSFHSLEFVIHDETKRVVIDLGIPQIVLGLQELSPEIQEKMMKTLAEMVPQPDDLVVVEGESRQCKITRCSTSRENEIRFFFSR